MEQQTRNIPPKDHRHYHHAPRILFEDQHLIVLSKPAGLLSQGERTGDENLVDYLRSYLGRNYVGLVHRLDRNTSGLMVVAKRTKSAQRLTLALQNDQLQRNYLAWVWGKLPQKMKWVHYLEKDEKQNQVYVRKSGARGKESILTVEPKKYAQWEGQTITLAEFHLETGRSHQIRVQSSHEGFPLLGDTKYGNRLGQRTLPSFPRLALHSFQLSFPHPMSGEIMKFEDPLPKELAETGR